MKIRGAATIFTKHGEIKSEAINCRSLNEKTGKEGKNSMHHGAGVLGRRDHKGNLSVPE